MPNLEEQILATISRRTYQPLKPKALARRLGIRTSDYSNFRKVLRELVQAGRVEMGRNHAVKPASPHGTITGTYRRTGTGMGFVKPHPLEGQPIVGEIRIPESNSLDASTGDVVLVKLLGKPGKPLASPTGEILRVIERESRQFVGTYFERDGEGLVRVDGTVFSHSISVGDPGAKGARSNEKVVIEMLRFPSAEDRGEAVIVEVLGPRGQPGVDTLSIIRSYNLPDAFPEDAKEEARQITANFREDDLEAREDFTREWVITIDPPDARDFDDAVTVQRDPETGHWQLAVHIADVSYFVSPGGPLDLEARRRATSVYLPQRVLPMFPEVLSNGLASLQQDKLRYVKSVLIDFTPNGEKTEVRFANGAIRNRRRFSYEQVMAILELTEPPSPRECPPEIYEMLLRMRDLALILRKRRKKRGALEMSMPEVELEYDEDGRVTGAHLAKNDISHQMIEEFMLQANEAVAEHLSELEVSFLRRVHPDPDPNKLDAFAQFARSLHYKVGKVLDRFTLQKILEKSADQPDAYAVHFGLLRSLKQAVYTPVDEGHYALASRHYCHFTSPIRRYPDLTVHRLIGQWLQTSKAGSDEAELTFLGEHCSKMERRAEMAERELIRVKLLTFLSTQIGLELDAIITGVADYGFFAQAERWPVEGLVHISTLTDDYYRFDQATHSLEGRRKKHRYRLGDRVHVVVVRVDLQRLQLDFRVAKGKKK